MSRYSKFDEPPTNSMALMIGLPKANAVCDVFRSPEKPTAQGPNITFPISESSPQEVDHGVAGEPSRHTGQMSNQADNKKGPGASISGRETLPQTPRDNHRNQQRTDIRSDDVPLSSVTVAKV